MSLREVIPAHVTERARESALRPDSTTLQNQAYMFLRLKYPDLEFKNLLLAALIAVYPILYIFQGIDFTDLGYSASTYKFIFSNPASLFTSFFPTYLTNIFGGLVHEAFGRWGLISFKIAYVVEIYIICCLAYGMLIHFFDRTIVLLSLLVSIIYINAYQYGTLNWMNYNDLTALFYAVAVFFMLRFFASADSRYLFGAGLSIGLNFFIRVSNLAGVIVAAVIVVDYFLEKEISLNQLIKRLVVFGSGILVAIVGMFVIMILLGHLTYYTASFRLLYDFPSLTPDHNMKSQLIVYFYDFWQSLLTATFFIFFGMVLLVLAKFVRPENKLLLTGIGLFVCFLLLRFDFSLIRKIREFYHVRWLFWQSGVVVLMLLYVIYKSRKTNYQLLRFALLSLIILIITPMGSGRSLLNANLGMWLALPLLISVFLDSKVATLDAFSLAGNSRFLFNITVLSLITCYAINANFHEVYRDSSDRLTLTAPIEHNYFRGIYTTRERATSIEELMHAVSLYVRPPDYVLGHEYFSMANYITDCPPYMYSPNPMYLSLDVYTFLYFKARKEIKALPVILSAKGKLDKQWPRITKRGSNRSDPVHDELFDRQRELIEALKQEGRYRKVWQNDFFEIWRPGERA